MLHDVDFFVEGGVVDPRVEHEAVELGFGKGVGAFLFDGVLGREDEERSGQGVALAGGRHGAFLHGLQKGRLRFGRRSVDLVGEDDVGEQRAFHKLELARLVEDLGADDVAGHQVRGELDAVEAETEGLGDGVDEERFGETRNAHKQNVPACKNGGGDLADHLILSHDDLADFGEQGLVLGAERVKRRFVVGEIRHSQGA